MNEIIQNLAVYALPVIFAITLHEAAHAYAAKYFGDTTAYAQGRMTLNPIKHIDPIGTILIPVVLYALSSPFLFGYAKPVPVNFNALRNPKRDMAWVALAGPAANFVMALGWLLLALGLSVGGIEEDFFIKMARAGVFINLVLLAFNLFPIPPLDGGRIMVSLLPNNLAWKFSRIEPYGFFIVLGLAFMNLLHFWMTPMIALASGALQILIIPVTFLLN